MKKQVGWWYMQLLCLVFLLGACSKASPAQISEEESPAQAANHAAIEDSYTRSFLVSDKEVAVGHYEMRTWTDAYSLWIPAAATLDEVYYHKRQKSWEQFLYDWIDEKENISYGIFGQFEDRHDAEEAGLRQLTRHMKYDGDYERTEDNKHVDYFGSMITEVGEEKIPDYSYLGFIKDKESNKSLRLIYGHNCSDWTTNCKADTDSIRGHFWRIMKSVRFEN